MHQKIALSKDGIVVPSRIRPYVSSEAKKVPSIRVARIEKLLQTKAPEIGIIRGEGLGDVIMTLPAIHALKAKFPSSRITYFTNTRYLDGAIVKVLRYNPLVDEISDREFLEDSQFDAVLNLHCPCSAYEQPKCAPINRIDLFAQHMGVTIIDHQPKYFVQQEEVEWGKRVLEKVYREKLMLVQPCASERRRSLDHLKLRQALQTLYNKYRIISVIVTHGSDFQTDTLWENIPGAIVLRDLDVRQIAAIMIHCNLVFCPDSSILHLAGALAVPTVGYFGPTDPRARVNYYKNAVALWPIKDHSKCSPCWWIGPCQFKTICFDLITVESIVSACWEHINKTHRVDINHLLKMNPGIRIQTVEV